MHTHARNRFLAIFSLFLVSCAAKKAPEHITVIAPEGFGGMIKLSACDSKASSDNVIVDTSGHGNTSVCSASPDLKLIAVRGKQSIEVPAKIERTGDNFVIAISAQVPSN
jgi:hypothetical protein